MAGAMTPATRMLPNLRLQRPAFFAMRQNRKGRPEGRPEVSSRLESYAYAIRNHRVNAALIGAPPSGRIRLGPGNVRDNNRQFRHPRERDFDDG